MEMEQYQPRLRPPRRPGAGRHAQERGTAGELDLRKTLVALGRRKVPMRVRGDLTAHDRARLRR